MIKKVSAVTATVLLALSLTVTSFGSANAEYYRHHHHGHGAAIVGGVALGILAGEALRSDREYVREGCYRGPRECRWTQGGCWHDEDGNRVCRPGHRECSRPVYCD